MNPILFKLGPIVVHSYAALIHLGLLLGGMLVLLRARRHALNVVPLLDAILAAALGGLLLARAAYVGVHWAYYADHPRHALQLWRGGLLWQGALLGGMIGAAAAGAMRNMRLPLLLDLLTPAGASVATFSWLGCHTAGCAWGIETYPGQGVLWALSLDLPNLYGIREPRVAVQLLGAGWSLALLIAVLALQDSTRRDGVIFSIWLTLHSFGSLGLGFLRADELVSIAGWRVDQLANLALGIVGIGLLAAQLIASDKLANRKQRSGRSEG